MARLEVYHERSLVGRLHQAIHSLEFEYASEWLNSADAFGISVSLPLGPGVRPGLFFANLLPEGAFREMLTRRLRIAYDDDFALLAALGGECAGALVLVPEGGAPDQPEARAEEMSLAELDRVAQSGAFADAETTRGRARLSLAGAQGKLPVVLEGERSFLPLGNTPSTHLLKFENAHFRHLPENEVFMTQLFRELGVAPVTVALRRHGSGRQRRSICCVTRYDRVRGNEGGTLRLHQEDLCQALGISSHQKYEGDGGPTFAKVYACVQRQSAEPLVDAEGLLDWWILCWLCGNSDAHAKNLAFLYHNSGGRRRSPRLAPFYDLVCTRAYDGLDRRLATSIGGQSDPGQVHEANLRKAAADVGVGPAFLLRRVRDLVERVPEALARVAEAQRERHGSCGVYERITTVVRKQARRTRTLLAG
jgi:serine/threonine-protein kinase HipA